MEIVATKETNADYNIVINANNANAVYYAALRSRRFDLAERATLLFDDQVSCSVLHHFAPGLYIRELRMPAGALSLGHKQRHEQWNVFLSGKMVAFRADGSTELLQAPMQFTGAAGRKSGYIVEDIVWQNVFASEERDVRKLEEQFLEKSDFWLQLLADKLEHDRPLHEADRKDYVQALCDLGVSQQQVTDQTAENNIISFPYGTYKVKLGDSPVHGVGLFATAPIYDGQVICQMRIGDCRTPAGRYTNHSATPNAIVVRSINGDLYLKAITTIYGCRGGFDGDEITIDYRQAYKTALGD